MVHPSMFYDKFNFWHRINKKIMILIDKIIDRTRFLKRYLENKFSKKKSFTVPTSKNR